MGDCPFKFGSGCVGLSSSISALVSEIASAIPPVSSVLKPLQDRPSLQKPSPGRAPQPRSDGLEASQPPPGRPTAIAPYSNPVDTASPAALGCSGSLEIGEIAAASVLID